MNRVMLVKSTCIDEQEYVRQHVPFSIKEQWFEMVPIQTNYQIVSEVVNKIIINTVNTVNTVNSSYILSTLIRQDTPTSANKTLLSCKI